MTKNKSVVNQPNHYQNTMTLTIDGEDIEVPLQVVDIIELWASDNAHIAHALTYLLRAGRKVPKGKTLEAAIVEDYAKAQWWIRRAIDFRGGHPDVPTTLT